MISLELAAFGALACTPVWWVVQGSNLWPLPCEGSALPLS